MIKFKVRMNNIKQNSKLGKYKWFYALIIIVWIMLLLFTIYSNRNSLGKKSYGSLNYNYVEVMDKRNDIIQEVNINHDIDAIAIRFEVYKKSNSDLNVEVIGMKTGETYVSKSFKVRNLQTASFNIINLDKSAEIKRDDRIQIKISTNDEDKSVGVWCSNDNSFGYKMFVGNGAYDSNVSLRLLYDDAVYHKFSLIIVSALAILVSILIITMMVCNKKHLIYTSAVLIFGLFYLIMITPFCGPDEVYHYERSLVFSNKLMGKDPYLIEEVYLNNTGYNFETDHSDGKEYSVIIDNFNKPLVNLNEVKKVEIEKDYVYWYDLCYTPYSLGITVAKLFKANPLITYYMGGLFGLISYAICIYFAIKISPIFKDMIGAISLLPVCLQQTTIYSSDLLIISMCILLFAYLMKWYCLKEKISKIDYAIVFAINALLAPDKAIYSLVVLLFFFVPKDKFNSNKERIIVMLLLIAPVFYQFAVQFLTRYPIFNTIFAEDGVNYREVRVIENLFTLEYALGHISETIAIILRTILYEFKDWIVGSLGRYLSNLNLILPSISAYIYLLLLLVASLFREEEVINPKLKISSLFISGIIVMMTIVYMLVGWTDISDTYIQGIQGRYFTPLLPFIFMIFNNKKVSVPKYLDKVFIFAQILIGFETLIFIFSYTFVY